MIVTKNHERTALPNIFNDLFKDLNLTTHSEYTRNFPAVNVHEDDNEFLVSVAIPGMDKKDFKIDLDNDILTISSEKNEDIIDKEKNYTRKEYSYTSFNRSFNLPENIVNNEKVTAKYSKGELLISLPKREETKPKPARFIDVE